MKISEQLFKNIVDQATRQAELLSKLSAEFSVQTPPEDEDESGHPQVVSSFEEAIIPFGHPDDQQLTLMNRHRSLGAEPYTS